MSSRGGQVGGDAGGPDARRDGRRLGDVEDGVARVLTRDDSGSRAQEVVGDAVGRLRRGVPVDGVGALHGRFRRSSLKVRAGIGK